MFFCLIFIIEKIVFVFKLGVLKNCQPSARPWRAAQTQTLFLVLSFVASLVVLMLLGYVVVQYVSYIASELLEIKHLRRKLPMIGSTVFTVT